MNVWVPGAGASSRNLGLPIPSVLSTSIDFRPGLSVGPALATLPSEQTHPPRGGLTALLGAEPATGYVAANGTT